MSNVTKQLDKLPPWFCRISARTRSGKRMLTNEEIAKAMGCAKSTVWKLSQLKTWERVPVGLVDRFTNACGVDHSDKDKIKSFWKRAKLSYLDSASPAQRRMIGKMWNTFAGSHRNEADVKEGSHSHDGPGQKAWGLPADLY